MTGIYKITSPSGNIYIGQSLNIPERWANYSLKSTEKQPALFNSINKYGKAAHIFEILEECSSEELNCRERFWQDEFDVLGPKGLNCVLTKCGDKKHISTKEQNEKRSLNKKGLLNPNSKDILDVETGVYYETVEEGAFVCGAKKNYLKDMLSGKATNKTNLIRGEDYEKGLKPNSLKKLKVRKIAQYSRKNEIIDVVTKQIYPTIKSASDLTGIKYNLLHAYLKGLCKNKSNLMFHSKYKNNK